MKVWRRFCMWLVFNVPLGRLAPHVLHMAMPPGVRMRRVYHAPPPKDRGDWQHDLDREVAWEKREEELERKEGTK